MLGGIIGDIVGSRFEMHPTKAKEFMLFHLLCRYTDDTVMSVAVADALLSEQAEPERTQHYARRFHDWYARYPGAGYGGSFREWAASRSLRPYGSWGNGSAMRVGPVGWVHETLEETIAEAGISAAVTHDHPAAIQGAQATAAAIFLARTGEPKTAIRQTIEERFRYDLDFTTDAIRPHYRFEVSCARTVPPALVAFFESESFEDAIRTAISLGGDSDTLACITGSIAEAYYGIPEALMQQAWSRLPADMIAVVERFRAAYGLPTPVRS